MKKLMLTAAAAAMATGAFAAAPAVYDYKASVKHMYLKEVNVKVGTQTVKVYQKYQKSATLKGYLIWDVLGATSTVVSGRTAGPQAIGRRAITQDHINNRCFLVVQNSSAEAQVRAPKILPGTLKAKWFDTKYSWDNARVLTSGVAEGVLFLGGDIRAGGVRPVLFNGVNNVGPVQEVAGPATAPYLLLDYGWTSIYLFGKFNSANGSGLWNNFQTALEAVQKIPGNTPAPGRRFYHDTWLNGTGIGKYRVTDDSEACCGFQIGGENITLDTLSGSLKGGLFLCSENGYTVSTYRALRGAIWEDQFYQPQLVGGRDAGTYVNVANTLDYDQMDVWTDGEIDQSTTDVVFGTWSIKFVAASKAPSEALTRADFLGIGVPAATVTDQFVAAPVDQTASTENLKDLNEAIKGAAVKLNRNVTFAQQNVLIPVKASEANNKRFEVPFMDANFATAYGLNRY